MAISTFRAAAIGLWFTLMTVLLTWTLLSGAAVTLSTALLLIVLAAAPPALFIAIWRGGPPQTIAEVLSSTERRQ